MMGLNKDRKKNIILYFRKKPEKDRFFFGDRLILPLIRRIVRRKRVGGIEKVFVNLCKSFDKLNIPYRKNIPFHLLKDDDIPIVLGDGKFSLEGYCQNNPIIAGIGLMTHPREWPDLFEEYPIAVYLQHSTWTQDIYKRYYGKNCEIWPVGIETDYWKPSSVVKDIDVLVYSKFLWDRESNVKELLVPILNHLHQLGLQTDIITYGKYKSSDYRKKLARSKSMIFLCEHESQGIAYQEALAMDVPIAAWDQGLWLDPNRINWDENELVPATSTPYFDETCGVKFKDLNSFNLQFRTFFNDVKAKKFKPREYVIKHLSLERSAEQMLAILSKSIR